MENLNFEKVNKRHPEESSDYIKIDEEKCIGCGNCEIICPAELFKIVNDRAELDSNYKKKCLECAHCWVMCEQEAIDFWYPDGGTGVIYENG